MLLCPRCKKTLATDRSRHGLTFVCPEGHGRAAAMPVIRRRVEPELVKDLWRRAKDAVESRGPPCPSCSRRMAEVAPATPGTPVVLDACARCHVVWFDPFEIETLPRAPEPPVERRLSPEAAEAIVRLEGQRDPEPTGPLGSEWTIPLFWATGALLPMKQGAPREGAVPYAVRGLALLLLAVHVASMILGGFVRGPAAWAEAFGFRVGDPWRHGGATWVTTFFLHAGIWHVLGNAYFLLLAGDDVERILGRARLGALLLLGSVAGCAIFLLTERPEPGTLVLAGIRQDPVLVGASGGISALFGWYAMALPRVRIGFGLDLGRRSGDRGTAFLGLGVRWVFALWLLWQLLLVGATDLTGVAYAAHVGGAVVGVLWWLAGRIGPAGTIPPP